MHSIVQLNPVFRRKLMRVTEQCNDFAHGCVRHFSTFRFGTLVCTSIFSYCFWNYCNIIVDLLHEKLNFLHRDVIDFFHLNYMHICFPIP
jgi:hypothetical protein